MLYIGLEELDGLVVVVAVVVVDFGLLDGNSRIVGAHMESIHLRLVGGCGFLGMVVGVVAAGRRVRSRLPWLVGIWVMGLGCMRGVR
jgi:hypothetical protein